MAIVGAAAAVAVVGGIFAVWATENTSAAPTVAPTNVGEPSISGTARVGQVLRTTRGTWTGTGPISYSYRWFRCDGRGAPDASDCRRITNAADNTYVLREADAGFRIRSQVVAQNTDGSARATSNPTGIVTSARPTNTKEPSISGTAAVGSRLQANRGEWAGDEPITYSYIWLRCTASGDNCSEIQGETDNQYVVRDAEPVDDPRSGHRPQRPGLELGHLEPDGRRRRRAGTPVGPRRGLAGGRGRPPRRRAGAVLTEPGGADGADHRARARHGRGGSP